MYKMCKKVAIAPGKKLLECLVVLHFITRDTVNKKGLRLGGNFSLLGKQESSYL